MKRIGIVLIVVALLAGTVSCRTPLQYTVTLSSTPGGSVTAPGEGIFTYNFCTEVGLVATPETGYRFVEWLGSVSTIADVKSASTTISTVQSDYSITAYFERIASVQYNLTISSTAGGSVTVPGEGVFTRDEGTVVSLVATPAGGYQFVGWTGDVGTIANVSSTSTAITMNDNYSITANFEAIPADQYNLTISSTSGGSVTVPGEGVFTRDEGTVVSLVATPASGYQFVGWTGDVGTIADVSSTSTTITMNSHKSITAHFAAEPPSAPLNPHFEADKLEVEVGETVTFVNETTGGTPPYLAAAWDFDGDGIVDSTEAAQPGETVTWVYTAPGVYNVRLTIVDVDETLTEVAWFYVTVYSAA